MNDIKIITKPTVRVVGRQVVDQQALDGFLADHDVAHWETDTEVGGEKLVEVAGRLCYMSFAKPRPGGNAAYIGHILEVGHGSVLEHAVYNLIITGVSRSLTHELVRHRAGWGFSQLSQRFVDESNVPFVVPDLFKEEVEEAEAYVAMKGGNLNMAVLHIGEDFEDDKPRRDRIYTGLAWLKCVDHTRFVYGFLAGIGESKLANIEDRTARRKAAREAARSVLPNATETKIFVTANARALRHFIEMRGDAAADAEIRRLAVEILVALQGESPNLFGDYEIHDGSASTAHRKV